MNLIAKMARRWRENHNGSVAIITGFTLPALVGFGVLAIDVGHFYSVKTEMQQAADISALAGMVMVRDQIVRDIPRASDANAGLWSAVADTANRNMPPTAIDKAVEQSDIEFGTWDHQSAAFRPANRGGGATAVRVDAEMSENRSNAVSTFLGKIYQDSVDVLVSSTAVLPVPPSLHILSNNASPAFEVTNVNIEADRLLVNSTAANALSMTGHDFRLGIRDVVVAGGSTGVNRSHNPNRTGAVALSDFLGDLPVPVSGGCLETDLETTDAIVTLVPGVYCGGVTITGATTVTLLPGGPYVFKDGPFVVDPGVTPTTVNADGVLIVLDGPLANLDIRGGNFNISAQRTGPWAGVAIMTARGAAAPETLRFTDVATDFNGIIYAPNSRIELVRGGMDGACQFACIVADTMSVDSTAINIGVTMVGTANPLGGRHTLPPSPPTLLNNFRPYIITELR